MFRFPAGARKFSFLSKIQTNFGAYPTNYKMGSEGCFLKYKEAELPYSGEVKNGGTVSPLLNTSL
jgi:hypothetical protein